MVENVLHPISPNVWLALITKPVSSLLSFSHKMIAVSDVLHILLILCARKYNNSYIIVPLLIDYDCSVVLTVSKYIQRRLKEIYNWKMDDK